MVLTARLSREQRDAITDAINLAAHHEAGHALACVRLGVSIESAQLRYHVEPHSPGYEYVSVDGVVYVADGECERDPDSALIHLAAGAAGGAWWRHRTEGGALSRLVRDELNGPRATIDMRALDGLRPLASIRWRDAVAEAETIVRKRWRDLRDLADELKRRDMLDARRVRRLIR